MSPKHLWFGGTAVVLLAADLATKAWITATLPYRNGFQVIEGFFAIVHARNTGAAFGFLAGGSDWVIPFFLAVGVLALWFLLRLLKDVPAAARLLPALLGGIAGGAVGNMADRIRYGYVVDFLDVYVGSYHWPTFNVADMGISVGVVAMLLLSLKGEPAGADGTGGAPDEA